MGGMWIYEARMFSKGKLYVTHSTQMLSGQEYEILVVRAYAEQEAVSRLRNLEGVTPETPIERMGWRYIEFNKEQ